MLRIKVSCCQLGKNNTLFIFYLQVQLNVKMIVLITKPSDLMTTIDVTVAITPEHHN